MLVRKKGKVKNVGGVTKGINEGTNVNIARL